MGEAPSDPKPVWRTPLAAALVVWMVLVVATALAAARLVEVARTETALVVILGVFVVAPPVLLVWSLWTMMREPVTGWIAPTVLMAFCGSFVPLLEPLLDAGVRLNFEARKPLYEAIAAEAKANRRPQAAVWVEGSRGGVRYRYFTGDPGAIDFVWLDRYGVAAGVHYDDTPCAPRPGLMCIRRGEPLAERFTYYLRFS